MSTTAERLQRVVQGMSRVLNECPPDKWNAPSPCEGWSVGDVADHVCDVVNGVLTQAGLPTAADENVIERWKICSTSLLNAVNDPELASRPVTGPLGTTALKPMAAGVVLHDVLAHTWDIASASGQAANLDEESVAKALESMRPMSDFIRGPGMYAQPVSPPDQADPETALLCFLGREAGAR